MNKRELLTMSTAAAIGLVPAASAQVGVTGPTLLTVSGEIGRTNRGPLDPVLDQLMLKHGIAFEKAFVFDSPALGRLPQVTIRPTLEYDAKPHVLRGTLLLSVLAAAGVKADQPLQLALRALDGYNVTLSLQDARSYRMIVATHIDGMPLGLGGLGPQWAVLDVDRVMPFKDRPLKERFASCPWGLYHLGVASA